MVQNGPNDHFGRYDLILNWISAFARPKWIKMVHFGPFWPEEVNFFRSANRTPATPEYQRKLLLDKVFREPFGSWASAPKIVDVCPQVCVFLQPADGEKLFDRWSSGRKGQECPREIRTENFVFVLFSLPFTNVKKTSGSTFEEASSIAFFLLKPSHTCCFIGASYSLPSSGDK